VLLQFRSAEGKVDSVIEEHERFRERLEETQRSVDAAVQFMLEALKRKKQKEAERTVLISRREKVSTTERELIGARASLKAAHEEALKVRI
jgi:hypothetical protein